MQKEAFICSAVILLCIGLAFYLWSVPTVDGRPVARASGSRPASNVPPDTSCCLIPANKGLHQ